ncbi:MAG: T9SS type A sorting domain-containing protein [Melioribacteraceae bacterium]|nr:T9SS type A sorting domain-containing protein [Melioribacteraceae bacterium]MCF8356747.1 T9SS type A sorting domain-containing protein [Melioribacteraceae bacterium]MCF8395970.1 T9SS type A sorting domain-containing protein [Melioribacteraceae bacterium]MCF8419533.1 T9SS type A sorting domain-containing protein [Melioribacteraceae bacterium]
MTNMIKGEIKNEVQKSIVDTTYLNPDSTIFRVKKKFVRLESEIDSVGRTDVGFWGATKFSLDKDSVYQNITVDLTTGVEDENPLEKKFSVSQNYPNPFNPTTKIKYTIPTVERNAVSLKKNKRFGESRNNVSLRVYSILGEEITTLVNEAKQPGTYEVEFDASKLPSGVYFYRLNAGDYSETKKMILIR